VHEYFETAWHHLVQKRDNFYFIFLVIGNVFFWLTLHLDRFVGSLLPSSTVCTIACDLHLPWHVLFNLATYRVFHGFGQAKFPCGGLVLSSSQISLLPQLPQKTTLNLKVVKLDSKIIISLCWSKSVTHFCKWNSLPKKKLLALK